MANKEADKKLIIKEATRSFTWRGDIITRFWGFKGARFKNFEYAKKYISGLFEELIAEGCLENYDTPEAMKADRDLAEKPRYCATVQGKMLYS